MIHLVVLAFAAGLAAMFAADWVTARVAAWAKSRSLVDEVNDRSSHSVPTPRIGGIGILAGLCAGLIIAMLGDLGFQAAKTFSPEIGLGLVRATGLSIFLCTVAAFLVGLADDRMNLSPKLKLLGQLLVAAIPGLLRATPHKFYLPVVGDVFVASNLVSGGIGFVWMLLLMNAVNFMDGINGLAGRFAQLAAMGLFAGVFVWSGHSAIAILCACLYGASEGFLRHNLGTAKTFMGDCGSHLVGAFIGAATLSAATEPVNYTVPTLAFVVLVFIFAFDVLFTLLRRTIKGESIWKAHRTHLYQRHLIASGENHARTLAFVESFLWLTTIAAAVMIQFGWGNRGQLSSWCAVAICVGLCGAYWYRVVAAEKGHA